MRRRGRCWALGRSRAGHGVGVISGQETAQLALGLGGDVLVEGAGTCAHLKLNERTIVKLVTDGTLPGVKIGNQWRFRKAMIDTWLDDQMLGVAPRFVESPATWTTASSRARRFRSWRRRSSRRSGAPDRSRSRLRPRPKHRGNFVRAFAGMGDRRDPGPPWGGFA